MCFYYMSLLLFHHLLYLSYFCCGSSTFVYFLPLYLKTFWIENYHLMCITYFSPRLSIPFQSFCLTVWRAPEMRCCCGLSTAVYCYWQRTTSSSHSVTQSMVSTHWLIKTLSGTFDLFLCLDVLNGLHSVWSVIVDEWTSKYNLVAHLIEIERLHRHTNIFILQLSFPDSSLLFMFSFNILKYIQCHSIHCIVAPLYTFFTLVKGYLYIFFYYSISFFSLCIYYRILTCIVCITLTMTNSKCMYQYLLILSINTVILFDLSDFWL